MKTQAWKKLYKTYDQMRCRCINQNSSAWKWYGGRGIKICNRWLDPTPISQPKGRPIPQGFLNFYEDMSNTWFINATIDRIDNNGDYCLNNCQWILKSENTRKSAKERIANRVHNFLDRDAARDRANKCVANGTHPFVNKELMRKVAKERIEKGTNPFQKKGMVPVLDIVTRKYVKISTDEYWKSKDIRYFRPNSKVARRFKLSKELRA